MRHLAPCAAAVVALMRIAQAAPNYAVPAMALSVTGAAMAQAPAEPVASKVVGRWLYDQKGNKIGSVRSLSDDGQTAVIMTGSYFQPGSHEATISVAALSVVSGHVTLRTGVAEALNSVSQERR